MTELGKELGTMRTYGRYVARDSDLRALREASELVAAALPHERARLKLYFHSGVKEYAESTAHAVQCMNALSEQASALR